MRILHLMPSIDSEYGGPPIVASRLAAAQAGLGHTVGIASYEVPPHHTEIAALPAEIPGSESVHRHLIPPPRGLDRVLAHKSAQQLGPVIAEYDVLHVHCIWEPMLRACAGEARRRGVPYVVVLHGMLNPWPLSQRRLKKRLALALGWRSFLNHAAFFHALNTYEVRSIETQNLEPPSEVIPNGIFFEEFDNLPAAGTFRQAHREIGDAPYILFLSRLHPVKGLDYLARAFTTFARENPDAHLVVAGPDSGAGAAFAADIRAAGLDHRVHMVGALYEQDKLAAIADADCFCLPSRHEGFSIAITEMLACGKPCVITEGCHYPEVAEVGAGAVIPLDADALADALVRIMADPDLRAEMSRNGRALVQSRFTWTKAAERAIEAYERRLKRP